MIVEEMIVELMEKMRPISLRLTIGTFYLVLLLSWWAWIKSFRRVDEEEPEVSTPEGQKTRGRVAEMAEMLAVRGCRPCRGSYTCWDSANCRLSAETRDHYGIVLLSDEESS